MPASSDPPAAQTPELQNTANPDQPRHGLVIVNYGKNQLVEDADDNIQRCVARRGLPQIVCGDSVKWMPTGNNEGVIEAIDPRRSVLYRADGNNSLRPLASNIDQIVIEAALQPALDYVLIDKYTVAAELAGAEPLIVINKSDLLKPEDFDRINSLLTEYTDIGYPTLFTSALENTGIEEFAAHLSNKTSILVGQSGVGKSSLIKRLLPEHDITVGKLSNASGLGKHTTTSTTLYHLPHDGRLIDSPGVRDFHLGEVDATELADGFREFHPLAGQCKFNNCRHLTEPGCAIAKAASENRISPRRLDSYRKLATTT
jgi:ribosome biogenesis GTPase